jgi:hypothetical protein
VRKAQKLRDEMAKTTNEEELARMRERLEHLERRVPFPSPSPISFFISLHLFPLTYGGV